MNKSNLLARLFARTCGFLLATAFLGTGVKAQAQILINLGTNPTITFDASPAVTADQWATLSTGIGAAGAGTYDNPGDVDAGAQTVDQSIVNQTLPTTGANGTSGSARHNTGGGYLVTQPTGVASAVLKATLRNNSGGDLNVLTVTYSYTIPVNPVTDSVPGQRVFYSLSGAPGSWTLIPNFSGQTTAGTLSATLPLGTWASGTDMYLMWLDDNNESGTDGAFTIDDVVFVASTASAITITNDPASLTVGERDSAVFTVGASGEPQEYHWLRDGVPIPGANGPTYTLTSAAYPADNGAVFSVIVSNQVNAPTSAGATLTVLPDTNAPVALVANAATDNVTITITFSEPMNAADPSSFQVFPTGTDPDLTGVAPSGAVPTGNDFVLTMDAGNALSAGVNYSVRIFDVYDTAAGGGILIEPYPTIIPIRRSLELIGFDVNNEWKYSIFTNLFGTGWETVGYDDSDPVSWPSGPAALGVNTDANPNAVPIRTTTAYAQNSAPQFFRRHFFLPASVTGTTLSIRHLFEDGAVVFINGQEAGRYNVGPGMLSVATRAAANFAENSPLPAPTPLPATNLVAGDNVIAVVVIQNGGTSSDSIMALELVANIGEFANGPAEIVTEPQSQSVAEGANVSFSVVADGELPLTYQWRRNGTPIPDATNASYSIIGVVPSQAGNFDVVVANNINSTNSAVATLAVTADTTSPVFVSAVGSTNLTNITLTITDAFGLLVANAEDESNYSVHLTAGGGNLTIESAVLLNSSNVLLTTSPRNQSQDYTVDLTNIRDRSEAQNLVTPLTRPLLAGIVILAPNDTTLWRFDAASNNLDGVSWQLPGFDDSSWLQGVAGFTTSNNLELTASGFEVRTTNMLAPNTGGPVTAYYRVPFSFPGSVANAQLHIVGVIDDGLVAYINGVEAGRLRVTNSPVSFNDLATAASPETGDLHGTESVQLSTASLTTGNNLLAIELHQNSTGSSDSVLSIQLVAEIAEFTPVGPTLTIVYSGGDVTITWSGGGTLQQSTDISSPANWSNVPGSPTSPYTTAAGGPATFYRVVVP